MDIVSLAHSKKEMALWFECDGCVSFHCVNGIGHITNVGSKKEVNDWYLNHFQKYCEHCAGENEYENVVSREKERERIRCKSCKNTQSFLACHLTENERIHTIGFSPFYSFAAVCSRTPSAPSPLADSTVRGPAPNFGAQGIVTSRKPHAARFRSTKPCSAASESTRLGPDAEKTAPSGLQALSRLTKRIRTE